MKIRLLGLTMAALLCGCSNYYGTRPKDIKPEAKMLPVPIVKPENTPGSLWPGENNRNMFFTDNKARYVNDIVTIIIDESSSGQNKASTNSSRDSSTTSGISAMLGLDTSVLNGNANLGGKLSIGGESSSALKGTGDTSRGGKLQAQLTARVVRVLENGNLLIEGRRQLTLNAEDEFIVITGIIRPEDISASNSVSSSNIADARILYTGSGVVTDKQHPGWLTRVLDWGWPF
jgi:flagellar L-ring protein precursor FlgH